MKFLYAVLFAIISLYTFLFSLLNISQFGGGAAATAVLSAFVFYRILKTLHISLREEERKANGSPGKGLSRLTDAVNTLIFSELDSKLKNDNKSCCINIDKSSHDSHNCVNLVEPLSACYQRNYSTRRNNQVWKDS